MSLKSLNLMIIADEKMMIPLEAYATYLLITLKKQHPTLRLWLDLPEKNFQLHHQKCAIIRSRPPPLDFPFSLRLYLLPSRPPMGGAAGYETIPAVAHCVNRAGETRTMAREEHSRPKG